LRGTTRTRKELKLAGDVADRFLLPPGWHFVSEPTGLGDYVRIVELLIATEVVVSEDNENVNHEQMAGDGASP
jgi:hypothetical protein